MMTETAELRRVAALRNQMLLDDVPKGRGKEFRMVRHDEYDDGGRS